MIKPALVAALALAAGAGAAAAQEAIQTGDGAIAPPVAEAPRRASLDPAAEKARENADWARGVIDRAARGEPARDGPETEAEMASRCPQPPDRKPHGEVWAGVGTGGYNTVGGVVTQPIGDCGSATVAISRSHNAWGRGRRR